MIFYIVYETSYKDGVLQINLLLVDTDFCIE